MVAYHPCGYNYFYADHIVLPDTDAAPQVKG